MKLVNVNGGHSIGVYNSETQDKSKVFRMMEEKRIRYYAPADYTEGSSLELLLKQIIDRTAANEILERAHFNCETEKNRESNNTNVAEIKKEELIKNLNIVQSLRTLTRQ